VRDLIDEKGNLLNYNAFTLKHGFTCHPKEFFTVINAIPSGIKMLMRYALSCAEVNPALPTLFIGDSDLGLSPFTMPEPSSFEYLAFKCKPPLSTTIFLIYRPPRPNPSFIPEMSNLLTTLCTMSTNIIVLGDMNIHVNSPTCRFAAEFLQLLDCFNLTQLVDVPTHTRGHTLDLVITNSDHLSNLRVYDLGISDHKVISSAKSALEISKTST